MTVLSKHEGGRYLLEFDRISTAEQVAAFLFADGRVPKEATLERDPDNFRRWRLRVREEHAGLLQNEALGQIIRASVYGVYGPPRKATHVPYVPPHVEREILTGYHPSGIYRYGDILLWVSTGQTRIEYDLFKLYPEDIEYYRQFGGYEGRPEFLLEWYKRRNRDMLHYVLEQEMPPSEAFQEMRDLEDKVFRLIIEAVATAFASGSLLPHRPPSDLLGGARRLQETGKAPQATGTALPNRMTGNRLGVPSNLSTAGKRMSRRPRTKGTAAKASRRPAQGQRPGKKTQTPKTSRKRKNIRTPNGGTVIDKGGEGLRPVPHDPFVGVQRPIFKWTDDNLQKMLDGQAPVGIDGKKVQLHHRNRQKNGPLDEYTGSEHTKLSPYLHPADAPGYPVDRAQFVGQRERYWRSRARKYLAEYGSVMD
jgi:hypothetical protein